ncbi:MAG: hypothetical protein ACYDHG_17735 [Desulfomonilaceae bacterium]
MLEITQMKSLVSNWFVAVAEAHPAKPPILQATDCKWLGWKNALEKEGIIVNFLCPDYVALHYEEKRGV